MCEIADRIRNEGKVESRKYCRIRVKYAARHAGGRTPAFAYGDFVAMVNHPDMSWFLINSFFVCHLVRVMCVFIIESKTKARRVLERRMA